MLHSLNSHVIAEQNLQDRLLSEQTDRLAGRNAMLNRQLQQLVRQIDGNVQEDLQRQEAETASERERIFMQIGGLAVFALALLLVLFFRDTPRCQPHRAIQAQDSRADWEAAGIPPAERGTDSLAQESGTYNHP